MTDISPDFKPLMSALAKAFHGTTGYEFQERYMGSTPIAAESVSSTSAGLYIGTGYYRASVVFTASENFRWKARNSEENSPEGTVGTLATAIQKIVKNELSASGRFRVQVEIDESCAVQKELAEMSGAIVRIKVPLKMDSGIIFMECAFHVPETFDLPY